MGHKTSVFALVTLVLAVGFVFQRNLTRWNIPDHLLGHPVIYRENLIPAHLADDLRAVIHSLREFPTLAQDLRYYRTLRDNIGEAEPLNAEGKCSHPLLIPDTNRSKCVLPGRVDIGRHFVKYGGVMGLKESYETMVSRTLSFGAYLYNISLYPAIQTLFEDPQFLFAAEAVCPPDKQYLDPFQANFIIGMPGQTVPLHLDAAYFWGASRFEFPQWLLAMMVASGLWRDRYVDQVQIVAYLHEWDEDRGGNFVYWDDHSKLMKEVPPKPLSGSAVDGAKTVHAGDVYRPDYQVPVLEKSGEHVLRIQSDGTWTLTSDGLLQRTFQDRDIRKAIVYRARCFRSEEEANRFRNQPQDSMMQLDDIRRTFAEDLFKRGTVKSVDSALQMPALDFAVLLMDTYIPYPLPVDAFIPINYCALGLQFPSLNSISRLLGCA